MPKTAFHVQQLHSTVSTSLTSAFCPPECWHKNNQFPTITIAPFTAQLVMVKSRENCKFIQMKKERRLNASGNGDDDVTTCTFNLSIILQATHPHSHPIEWSEVSLSKNSLSRCGKFYRIYIKKFLPVRFFFLCEEDEDEMEVNLSGG